ncbi:MAG TPA: CpaD family pilus assembly protein [Roseiarcus sp.]|jgi:pilus assembly protein CpaD
MSPRSTHSRPRAPTLRLICLTAATAIGLAGCMTDSSQTASIAPDDYHQRHPIVLTQSPTTLDVFPVGRQGALDSASVADIRAFAVRYQSMGGGRVVILSPSASGYRTRPAVNEIRRVLASAGLTGPIGLGSYPVGDPSLASPIRLAFRGLKAEVASRCGQWPQDLASGGSLEGWKNENYWNFGCATQSMLAAQVDDPRDLARARALGPSDEEMRLRAIAAVRQGQDPTTNWKVELTPIGQVGGN